MPFNSKTDYNSNELSQLEQDIMNEQELDLLKRKYISMQNESKLCRTYCDNFLSSSLNNYLDRLDFEQVDVDTNLKLAQSTAVTKRDADNYNEISKLRSDQLRYCKIVSQTTEKCDNMDIMIQNLEKEIELQQKKNGGAIRSHASHVGRIKRIRVYENRLNTATVQFNNLLTENTDLREKIEHFRKQRKVFNTLYKRLASKSSNLKFQIDEVIASATAAYNARDESHSKMMNLNERNNNDYKHFIEEEKEMTRIIAQESGLQAFMNTKNSEKSELAYQEALIRHQTHESRAEHQQEQEMAKFEKVLSAIINVLGEEQGTKLMHILHDESNKHEKIANLTEAIQPVCDRYKKTEEQNFSLFQFVNEISHDVKRLNEKISLIANERASQKADTQKQVSSHTTKLTQLRCSLQDHESDLKNLDLRLRATHENFNSVRTKVDSLFKTLRCDSTRLDSLLDNRHEVTPQNLNLYLASIENTINNLMERDASEKASKIEESGANNKTGVVATGGRITVDSRQGKRLNAVHEISTGPIDQLDSLYCDLDRGMLDPSSLRDRAKQIVSERIRTNTPRRKTKAKL